MMAAIVKTTIIEAERYKPKNKYKIVFVSKKRKTISILIIQNFLFIMLLPVQTGPCILGAGFFVPPLEIGNRFAAVVDADFPVDGGQVIFNGAEC